MIGLPSETRVWLASGATDMRRGFDGLALVVQETLKRDPHCGHLFVFRGRTRANLIKIIYWDGTGFCLITKRLERGVFLWPPSVKADETLSLTSAQLSLLIEGVDWRAPEQRWRPAMAGFRAIDLSPDWPSISSQLLNLLQGVLLFPWRQGAGWWRLVSASPSIRQFRLCGQLSELLVPAFYFISGVSMAHHRPRQPGHCRVAAA